MNNKFSSLLFIIICVFTLNCFAGAGDDLFTACKKGDLDGVKKAITAGAQVNALDAAGNPAITSAFFWPDVVKYLLDNGADPNLGNTTVLYQAAFYCSTDVIKLVLDKGADPNKACKSDAASAFKNLIDAEKAKGKSANKASIKAWEAAMALLPAEVFVLPNLITNTNCVAGLKMLFDKGAKADIATVEGTLLHTFANSGASAEYRNNTFAAIKKSMEPYGYTFPDWYVNMPADRNGTPDEILKLLLSKGLDINAKNKGGGGIPPETPLEVALGGGFGNKEEVTLALVNNGADVKIESSWYGPVILQAAQCGFATVLKAMIEKGADINTEGKCFTDASNSATIKDFTPLTCAAAKNRLEAVKLLLEKGAKTDGISGLYAGNACAPDLKNKSAIYFAIENKNMDMIKFIAENHGYNNKKLSITAKKISNCVGGGSYAPSEYAKALELKEISAYLKTQGI